MVSGLSNRDYETRLKETDVVIFSERREDMIKIVRGRV
jgi:hypothetical protein